MTRPMPWRVRALVAIVDAAAWPLWWLLDRGTPRLTTPNPNAIPMPAKPCPVCGGHGWLWTNAGPDDYGKEPCYEPDCDWWISRRKT